MKTLLISEIFPPVTGGSGRWFWETYRRMPREHFVIAAGSHPEAPQFDATHDLDIVRLPLTFTDWGLTRWQSLRQYYQVGRQLRTLIRQRGITHLHCGRCLPEGWIGLWLSRLTGIPFTCYVHGEDANAAMANESTGVMSSRQLRWMTGQVLRRTHGVIANSLNSQAVVRDQWSVPASRIHVLHPGVDTTYFTPALRDVAVRTMLGWGERPVLLTAGRLQKRKGQDMVIRALPQIRQQHPDILYAIIGGGEEAEPLRQLTNQLDLGNHVQFMGKVSDEILRLAYQQADVFVLANRQIGTDIEGFGMVLLEAQASGTAVIAGNSGGTPETLEQGVTGLVVPCEQPEPLASEVSRLLNDAATLQSFGLAARRRAVDHFDWESLARQAARLFQVPAHQFAVEPHQAEATS